MTFPISLSWGKQKYNLLSNIVISIKKRNNIVYTHTDMETVYIYKLFSLKRIERVLPNKKKNIL